MKATETTLHFPFGSPLKKIQQKDRSPKDVFVLGVYASAVHARWLDSRGRQKVAALAVASEPEIFWKGDNSEEIISGMKIPDELGRLVPPSNSIMNGPSGRALDNLFLKPLGIDRTSAWLCDLLPESRVNVSQRRALNKHYTNELVSKFGLQQATVPDFNKAELNNDDRRIEILQELEKSNAQRLVLLGDLPIRWFLHFHDARFSKLSQFGITNESYGKPHVMVINGKEYEVIALCHPRQADRLGRSSDRWGLLHDKWVRSR